MNNAGDIIRNKRLEMGLSRKQFGDKVGLRRQAVRRIELGLTERYRFFTMIAIAELLEMQAVEIFSTRFKFNKEPCTALRDIRISMGLSQKNVADRCETTVESTISSLETGRKGKPHDETKRQIAAALGVNETDIWPHEAKCDISIAGMDHEELRRTEKWRR